MTLDQQLTELAMKMREERTQRWKVEWSEEYIGLQNGIAMHQAHIQANQEKQQVLLSQVPDSTEEYEAVKRMLIEEMRAKGLERMGSVVAKFISKNEVNTRSVMDYLEGDLDNFYRLAKISQKDLKDFEKDNESYKGIAKKCVDEVGRELVDISVELPE